MKDEMGRVALSDFPEGSKPDRSRIQVFSLCFPLAALGIISGSIFQAFSQSIYSLIISLGRQLVVLLPAAWLLSKTGNVTNVWWAFPIAEGVSVVLSFIFFRMIYGKIVKPLEQPNP